jgi:hypothetical protein
MSDEGSNSHMILALSHILILAPGLLWIAFNRAGSPNWVYGGLLFLGIFLMVYHGYRAFVRIVKKSPYAWVNLLHALVIAPLLVYIGWNARDTPRAAYELLAMVGFAGIGYHIYSLITMLQIHDSSKAPK